MLNTDVKVVVIMKGGGQAFARVNKMIFKFCVWPSEAKEGIDQEDTKVLAEDCRTNEQLQNVKRLGGAAICCCPCIFRSRKSVDVDKRGTPVIALTLNQGSDTAHDSAQ